MIEFNKVTWYSKLLAAVFLLGILPALAFYIGMRYQETASILSETSVAAPAVPKRTDPALESYADPELGISFEYSAKDFSVRKEGEPGSSLIAVYALPQPIEFGPMMTISRETLTENDLAAQIMRIKSRWGSAVSASDELVLNGRKWSHLEIYEEDPEFPGQTYEIYLAQYDATRYLKATYPKHAEPAFSKILNAIRF